jgi:hypothetical protein
MLGELPYSACVGPESNSVPYLEDRYVKVKVKVLAPKRLHEEAGQQHDAGIILR